eukprot:9991703-Alexandrium_andersonii.AAC.1
MRHLAGWRPRRPWTETHHVASVCPSAAVAPPTESTSIAPCSRAVAPCTAHPRAKVMGEAARAAAAAAAAGASAAAGAGAGAGA